MTKDIRFDSITGFLEDNTGLSPVSLHFSEWWNGEGLDFIFSSSDKSEKQISLHLNEIKNLAIAALAAGYLDLEEVKEGSEKLLGKKVENKIVDFETFLKDESTHNIIKKVFFSETLIHAVLKNTIMEIENFSEYEKHKFLIVMPTYTNAGWSHLQISNPILKRSIDLTFRINQMMVVKTENDKDSIKFIKDLESLFTIYFVDCKGGTFDSFCNLLASKILNYLYN